MDPSRLARDGALSADAASNSACLFLIREANIPMVSRLASIESRADTSMIARGLHHASFPVTDLERSKDFYGRVLGLEPIERPALPFPGAWYRAGECEVHLIVPFEGTDVGRPPDALNPLAVHTAFAIDDYAAVRDRLAGENISVLETGEDVGQMWVRDPDGHVIELIVARR